MNLSDVSSAIAGKLPCSDEARKARGGTSCIGMSDVIEMLKELDRNRTSV
jgi:hypothetical protein